MEKRRLRSKRNAGCAAFPQKMCEKQRFFLKSLDFFRKPCYNKQRWFSHGFLPYSNPKIERCEPPINSMNREVNEVAEY